MPLPDESLGSEAAGQETSAGSESAERAAGPEEAAADHPAPAESPPAGAASEIVVVGIGASAGGLDALFELLREMPASLGAALVIVQHLDPTHDSILDSLLDQRTALTVEEARDATVVEPNHVYVIPPNRQLVIEQGTLRLTPHEPAKGNRQAIDRFFQSLAWDRGPHAVGIILSGTGSDGTAGLKKIREQGGLTFVQAPDEAQQEGMPRNAMRETPPDAVLPAAEISEAVEQYVRDARARPPREAQASGIQQRDRLQAIVALLYERTECDFSHYRQTTLRRRVQRRMGFRRCQDLEEYAALLAEDTEEVETLYDELLIGVTRFFRDPDAWEVLDEQVLKPLVAATENGQTLRVWCPGCASGEEAYSVAMLLHEQRLAQAKRCRLQVFGTDISQQAIKTAREGRYPGSIRQDLSPERLRRFFTRQEDGRFQVAKRLRKTVVFAEQNLLAHPPFANLDLICCRNLAIYLEEEAQHRIDATFDFALKPGGYLFLGDVENLKSHREAFTPVSEPWRIFRHTASTAPDRGALASSSSPEQASPSTLSPQQPKDQTMGLESRVARQIVAEKGMGVAVIDGENRVLYLQGPVDRYLQLRLGEAGPQSPGILDLARMGVRSRLHTLLARVRQNRQMSATTCHIHAFDTTERRCNLTVRPLDSADSDELLVTFEPLPSHDSASGPDAAEWETPATIRRFGDEPAASPADEASSADDAYQEEWVRLDDYRALQQKLATTQEQLSSSIEDLATANEELRATNEEAISVNEELQSSNEELQTSKEELQSLNEELTTLNNQLEVKLQELQQTTDDLDNLLNSSHVATLFLDLDLQIRLFTPSCRSLFHLIASDTGRPLEDIARRFPDDALLEDAADVIGDAQPRQTRVKTGPQQTFLRVIRPYRTEESRIQGVVISFTDISELQVATEQLAYRELQQEALADLGQRAMIEEDVPTLLKVAVETIQQTMHVDFATVWRWLPRQDRFRLEAGQGWAPDQIGAAMIEPHGRSQAGYTVQLSQSVIATDLPQEKRFEPSSLVRAQNVTSGLSMPVLSTGNEPYGVLSIHNRRRTEFTDDDIHFIQSIANILGEAINRHRIERKWIRQRDELDTIYQTASVGLCVLDRQCRFLRINERLAETNGIAAADHLGKTVREVAPDLANPLEARIAQLFATGKPIYGAEVRGETLATPGKERIWREDWTPLTDRQGNVVAVNVVAVEVTEQRRAEQDLRESEHRFRALVEAAAQIVWTTDAAGNATEDTPSWRHFTGQSLEQCRQSGWLNAVHPDDREKTRQAWRDAVQRKIAYQIDYRLRHHSGSYYWMTARAAPIRDSEGIVRGWVGMNTDITQRKEFEKALQDARRRAEVANQSKSDFLANMSHEIRTPMTAILGYADLLAENLDNPEDLQHIETIRRNGRFLLEIVNDILDLSKIEADKMEVTPSQVSPEALIGEVVSLMNVRAEEKEIPLRLQSRGQLPQTIQSDGVRLRQILLNLVGNAIKFTEDGEVRLVAEVIPDKEQIRFEVIDTGIGIGEEQQRRLFQPFNQVDSSITRSHGGTGLGLAISQRLANLLGGELQLESHPGQGSVFSVTVSTGSLEEIPMINPQWNLLPNDDLAEPPQVPHLDCRILVVDDRRDIRYLARQLLQSAGAAVELCENGQQAIELLTGQADPPEFDLILMDISMPVMDGYTAATKLREAGIPLPMIALTANAMEGDRDKCLASGFTDYTTKPLNKQKLVELVARYV